MAILPKNRETETLKLKSETKTEKESQKRTDHHHANFHTPTCKRSHSNLPFIKVKNQFRSHKLQSKETEH